MPLLSILRFLFALLSLALLGLGLWAALNWYNDEAYRTVDGSFHVVLIDWRVWIAALLFLWSFIGRFFWVLILGKPDRSLPSDPTVPEGEKMRSSTGAEISVTTTGAGDGPALVFIHGWAMDSSLWSYARRHFGSSHTVVTLDLPGLGRSKAGSAITLDGMADDVLTVLDRVDKPVVLIGHSIGGMIIQTMAQRRADLFDGRHIAGAVLVNTTYTTPLRTMILPGLMTALQPLIELVARIQVWLFPLAWLSAWQRYLSGSTHKSVRLVHGAAVTRSQLDHTALASTRSNPAVVAKGDIAMFHKKTTNTISLLTVPVRVLGGDSDIVTKPSASEYIAASAPSSELEIKHRANHMSVLDQAPSYHQAIEGFVSKIIATTSA